MRSILLLVLVIWEFMVVYGGVVKRSDDADLQTLVQQQAAAISTLQATVNSLQAGFNTQQATINSQQVKITGLENKVQTLSKTVAFTTQFSHDDANDGIPLGLHQILQFDKVITNAGNGYDPTTGIFTAPLAGYYAFAVIAMEPATATHPSLELGLLKNGVVIDQLYAENAEGTINEQGSTHAVLHLAAGDRVWIRQEGRGDSVRGSFWTVFTGYLVHSD